MTDLEKLAKGLSEAKKPDTLRFSVCTVPGRQGYSWGAVVTSDEATVRLLCDVWNNRKAVAEALRRDHLLQAGRE
jgi:hypothetical protein